jgi:hypothetical protein
MYHPEILVEGMKKMAKISMGLFSVLTKIRKVT